MCRVNETIVVRRIISSHTFKLQIIEVAEKIDEWFV